MKLLHISEQDLPCSPCYHGCCPVSSFSVTVSSICNAMLNQRKCLFGRVVQADEFRTIAKEFVDERATASAATH
jgi:hypothetical protein